MFKIKDKNVDDLLVLILLFIRKSRQNSSFLIEKPSVELRVKCSLIKTLIKIPFQGNFFIELSQCKRM